MSQEVLMVVNPFFLGGLLQFFEGEIPLHNAYWYATGMTAIALLQVVLRPCYFHLNYVLGWNLRAATTALMYKKVGLLNKHLLFDFSHSKTWITIFSFSKCLN